MKKLLSAVLCLALLFSMPAGAFAGENGGEWADSTAEEIMERLGLRFGYTEEMESVAYQISESAAQMQFMLNDIAYTARLQPTAGFENISGFQYDSWPISVPCTIGWCEARAMMVQQEDLILALCLWYDAAPGLMYSVSAYAGDLKGLDIQAAAEAVFAPMQNEAGGLSAWAVYEALTACTGYAGTVGSSLKNAMAACGLAAFASENRLADLDEPELTDAVAGAVSQLDENQRAELFFNLESIHSVLSEAFTDYAAISGLFDDAGMDDEITLILAADRSFEHYSALYEELMAAGM